MYDQIISFYDLEELVKGKDKILVYDGNNCRGFNWYLITREDDSMNLIVCTQYPHLLKPLSKLEFDTIQFINRNKKLLLWTFDSLPLYSHYVYDYLDSISDPKMIPIFGSGISVVDRNDSILFQDDREHGIVDSIRPMLLEKLSRLDYMLTWLLFRNVEGFEEIKSLLEDDYNL